MNGEITQLLFDHTKANPEASNQLYQMVYDELHQIAHFQLKKSWDMQTINTTALVSEVYLKLINAKLNEAKNRNHFYAIAANAMRQIIINYAEKKQSQKRGKDWHRLTDSELVDPTHYELETLILIDKALKQLAEIDPGLCQLVELKFFAGLTENEISEIFGVTTRTVRRNWLKAKILLAHSIG